MEMDQTHLKDMGIKKVGDRVRIGSQAKQLRNKEYKKASRRTSNRQSLAVLDNSAYTPPSSSSPRPLHSARSIPTSSRSEKRMSRQITNSDLTNYAYGAKSPSRPSSPLVDQDSQALRSARHRGMNSPKDPAKKDFSSAYGAHPLSASSTSASSRYPRTSEPHLPKLRKLLASPITSGASPVLTVQQTVRYCHKIRLSSESSTTVDERLLSTLKAARLLRM